MRYTDTLVQINFFINNSSTASWAEWGFLVIPMDLRPHQAINLLDADGDTMIKINVDSGKISRKVLSGNARSKTIYAEITYKRRVPNSTTTY